MVVRAAARVAHIVRVVHVVVKQRRSHRAPRAIVPFMQSVRHHRILHRAHSGANQRHSMGPTSDPFAAACIIRNVNNANTSQSEHKPLPLLLADLPLINVARSDDISLSASLPCFTRAHQSHLRSLPPDDKHRLNEQHQHRRRRQRQRYNNTQRITTSKQIVASGGNRISARRFC